MSNKVIFMLMTVVMIANTLTIMSEPDATQNQFALEGLETTLALQSVAHRCLWGSACDGCRAACEPVEGTAAAKAGAMTYRGWLTYTQVVQSYCTALILYCTVLHYTVLHSYCTALVLYCTHTVLILYYTHTVLHQISSFDLLLEQFIDGEPIGSRFNPHQV
jgi:hypothetical protein